MTESSPNPLPTMLKFERFGNAYAADFGESFYIVSLYCGAWCGYYSTADGPKQVGPTYGCKSPVDAMHACQDHARGINR